MSFNHMGGTPPERSVKLDEDISDHLRAAKDIGTDEFRQILIWPLALSKADRSEMTRVADDVKVEAEMLDKGATPWRRVSDPLYHIKKEIGYPQQAAKRQEPYAEFVYFHDFVQRFLYPTPEQHARGEAGFHLFERSDVEAVRVDLGVKTFKLAIDRCNLYLFRTGVAILVLEVTSESVGGDHAELPTPFNLNDVLQFQDLFRRVYTPYFEWRDAEYVAGQIPHAVTWLGSDGNPVSPTMGPLSLEAEMERLIPHREPPVHEAWRWLLGLRLRGYDGENGERVCWRHIIDDRIPFISYVRLQGGIEQVSPGNWVRLCFADQPAEEKTPFSYPYDKNFLKDFELNNCYDRFFDSGTRYTFCGYAMTAVGTNVGADGFFFENVIKHHFRHMYFQMSLIAHMEYATYLSLSSRISQAVEDAVQHGGTRGRWFRERILKIHDDFLEFIHIFRFTGVSNQLQGKEMFDQWRKHLRLAELFGDLQDELKSATDYQFAKESHEQTEAASRLNVIAVAGVVLGLVFAFLGMNVITGQDAFQHGGAHAIARGFGILGVVLSVFSAIALGAAWFAREHWRLDNIAERPIRRMLLGFLGTGALLTLAGFVASWLL